MKKFNNFKARLYDVAFELPDNVLPVALYIITYLGTFVLGGIGVVGFFGLWYILFNYS